MLPVVLCGGAMFLLGLGDDIAGMDPQHKLAGQIIVSAVILFFGYSLAWSSYLTVNLFLSLLWLVGITNAFNLLDNMDGLSAGIAAIASAFLCVHIFLDAGETGPSVPLLLLNLAFLGSVLGFLFYNFNPASIFMGDAGSLFIGFMLACQTMAGTASIIRTGFSVHILSVIAIPVLILFVPILDTGFVSLMRRLFRRPISRGGRDHSSHRMVAIGFSEKKAVLVLYLFAAMSGLVTVAIRGLSTWTSLALVAFYLLLVLFFWIYLGKVKVYQEPSLLSGKSAGIVSVILVEITYKRRILEVLLDLFLVTVSYYTSYLLRFEGALGGNFEFFLKSLPVLIACQIFSMYLFGVYKGVWESAGLRDLVGYIKAVTAGTVMAMLIPLFLYRFESFSRAVFVIHWVIMIILVSLSRLSFRLLDEGIRKAKGNGRPALIYGAGVGGQMALKEIETNKEMGLALVGFMDDNSRLHGKNLRGYPVLGGQDKLEEIILRYNIKEIIVSFKEKGEDKKREIIEMCARMGKDIKVSQMKLSLV
jgi:UDP-GlcNAc:undecaprenyl-phosphate GlcNAc-1-phosphate transferase